MNTFCKIFSIIFGCTIFLCASCISGNENKKNADEPAITPNSNIAFDTTLPTGKVIDTVFCSKRNEHSFALYLPSYYTRTRSFPCIYFFDSHAHGFIPVKNYKSLAEKYGFVLVGSNVSKNGTPWQETNEGVKILIEDTKSRINIDPKRVYTSGFSGGARVAGTIALADGGVAGVIGCAGGFSVSDLHSQNKFDYFSIAGDCDFNSTDMELSDEQLGKNGFNHQFISFNGKHEWAHFSEMETGLLWMQVSAMKENLQPKNDTLISDLKNDFDNRIDATKKNNDLITRLILLNGAIRVFSGLEDVGAYKKQMTDLLESGAYKNAQNSLRRQQEEELKLKDEFGKQFATENVQWWAKRIGQLSKSEKDAKNNFEKHLYTRLLNYLGLLGYLHANQAINMGDLERASSFLNIFKMADPKNPDCGYLSAMYDMKNNDSKKALAHLSEAAILGYNDEVLLTTNPLFRPILYDATFKKLLELVRANARK